MRECCFAFRLSMAYTRFQYALSTACAVLMTISSNCTPEMSRDLRATSIPARVTSVPNPFMSGWVNENVRPELYDGLRK